MLRATKIAKAQIKSLIAHLLDHHLQKPVNFTLTKSGMATDYTSVRSPLAKALQNPTGQLHLNFGTQARGFAAMKSL
jgi:hypothetical protein